MEHNVWCFLKCAKNKTLSISVSSFYLLLAREGRVLGSLADRASTRPASPHPDPPHPAPPYPTPPRRASRSSLGAFACCLLHLVRNMYLTQARLPDLTVL